MLHLQGFGKELCPIFYVTRIVLNIYSSEILLMMKCFMNADIFQTLRNGIRLSASI